MRLITFGIIISTFISCTTLFSNRKISEAPGDARIFTSDIENFYRAFDLALEDTANAKQIFEENYFKVGSKGLKDFYKSKIQSKEKFADFVIYHRDFYRSIEHNINDLSDLENLISINSREFKMLYAEAVFPDVYFVVGRFSSNGTISRNGLLIGTEILSKTPETNTENWNSRILEISMERNHIPVTVAHELVHFNQDGMRGGNTLLWKSIREGSAEFIAEMITGQTDADYSQFEGREKESWKEFKEDMGKSIWTSWQQESEKRPRNAGYWAGYLICKSYYNQIGDKEKTISDILNIQDYPSFYESSQIEKYIDEKY